ncbi:MinD/ParA family ATP-binding protein [Nocardia cyriacigeorgica]|uniref:MinD/ParA family ATP-binding protein n=1 Tax=Nocardia cyriacigeorgica TaxID=135487 RepID=UPI002453BD58|nr:MinD/ParA family protein [Nocardia cyriacigeorgica]
MNRAPTTNGHSAEPARARGGYDAYFAQQLDRPVNPAAGPGPGASAGSVSQPPAASAPQPAEPGPQPVAAAPPPATGETGPSPSVTTAGPISSLSMPSSDPTQAAPPAPGPASTNQAQAQAMPTQPGPAPAQTFPVDGAQPDPSAGAQPHWVPDRIGTGNVDHSRVEVLPVALTSIELLSNISAANQAQLRSNSGVRGALNKVGFKLGLSPAEQRTEERRGRIRRQLNSTYQIAMVSVKGGVGRTTTTAALGSTFAGLRPDRVVAIDANPDFGDLSTRTVRHPYGLTLRELARDPNLSAFSAVQSYTSINSSNLAVLASPWTTEANEALSGTEYGTGVEILRRHYNLLMVDCGTGVLDSATRTVLQTSDAVVVVTPATVGGVTGAVATLNWLSTHGLDRLIAKSIVAIVHHQPLKPTVDVEAIENLFATAQRPTFTLPYDPHLAEGGEIDLRLVAKETLLAFEELAAALADDFPTHLAGDPGHHGGWR